MRSGSRTAALAALVLFSATCGSDEATGNREQEDAFQAERILMVRSQIERRGIRDEAVLRAMQTVPREEFVPASERRRAYSDRPLPIGEGQTISQPYIVALMSSLARITPGQRVLEIGTGSGYQAAVLAELEVEVYSIELLPGIAARAETTLGSLGYGDINLRVGDGYLGWPEAAPFDRIVVTAAPPEIPQALLDQLAPGGRLVAPVGPDPWSQRLVVATRGEMGRSTSRTTAGWRSSRWFRESAEREGRPPARSAIGVPLRSAQRVPAEAGVPSRRFPYSQ